MPLYELSGVKTFEFTKIIGLENITFGSPVILDDFVLIYAKNKITIGNYVHIGCFSSVTGGESVWIGDFAAVSQGCRILTGTDDFSGWGIGNSTVPEKFRNTKREPIAIGNFCIIGANTVVLPGVTIGEGAMVGAGSVVTRDLEPWGIYIGNRKIRDRNKSEALKTHEEFIKEIGRLTRQ